MKIKDVNIGDSIGSLTIIGPPQLKQFSNRKQSIVRCRCICGTEKDFYVSMVNQYKSCGCKKARGRERHHAWKGGRYYRGGYLMIKDSDHPNADGKGYVAEHVKVMSQHLGRPLVKGENVHHKNGVRDDNRLKNLEIWSTSQPAGQRIEDKVAYAKEILSLYEPEALA